MSDLKPLYPVNRQHLEAMSDEVGIWQHATGATPNRAFGYCTDDVARALIVDLLQAHELGWQPVAASVRRALRFLLDAFDPITGRFRNLRGADGGWLEAMGSQDCHARALVALGRLISEAAGFGGEPALLPGPARGSSPDRAPPDRGGGHRLRLCARRGRSGRRRRNGGGADPGRPGAFCRANPGGADRPVAPGVRKARRIPGLALARDGANL
jgi:hypothetical protein